jgi:hypothetical protein
MFQYFNNNFWIFVFAGGAGVFFLSVFIWTKRKIVPSLIKNIVPGFVFSRAPVKPHFFNDIIDIPKEDDIDEPAYSRAETEYEDEILEMVGEAESVLLREAEALVDEIERTLQELVSGSNIPETFYDRIRSVVSAYSIFLNTEYYEAINNFIRITADRDCDIKWTDEELHGLWK